MKNNSIYEIKQKDILTICTNLKRDKLSHKKGKNGFKYLH